MCVNTTCKYTYVCYPLCKTVPALPGSAEAHSADVVRDAAAHCRVNQTVAEQEPAIARVAKVPEAHADGPLFKIFQESGLAVPVPVNFTELDGWAWCKYSYIYNAVCIP